MKLTLSMAAAAAFVSFTAMSAHAQTPALAFDQTTGEGLGNPPFTLGWEFTTSATLNVVSLGFFDDSQDGLAESHEVGLWDSSGTLIDSTTVTTTDPLTLQWRYHPAPAVLAAGQTYFIGALFTSGADPVVFPGFGGTVTTIPQISYVQATYAGGGSLSDPTNPDGTNGFFGPNFTVSTIPEPSTWALMLIGFGALGLAARANRKAAAVA
jgi:hypothetical protein